jgi:hypothetical protein
MPSIIGLTDRCYTLDHRPYGPMLQLTLRFRFCPSVIGLTDRCYTLDHRPYGPMLQLTFRFRFCPSVIGLTDRCYNLNHRPYGPMLHPRSSALRTDATTSFRFRLFCPSIIGLTDRCYDLSLRFRLEETHVLVRCNLRKLNRCPVSDLLDIRERSPYYE